MGAGAVGSRAERFLIVPALHRDEGRGGEVVMVHGWPVSSSLPAARCQSHAELPGQARGQQRSGAAPQLGTAGTAGVKLTSVFLGSS